MECRHFCKQLRETGCRLLDFQRTDLRRVFGILPQSAVPLMLQDVFTMSEAILQRNDLDAPSAAIVDERNHLLAGKSGCIRQRGMFIERKGSLPLHDKRVDPPFGNPVYKTFHCIERHHLGTEIEVEGPDREIPGPGITGSDARKKHQQPRDKIRKAVSHGSIFRF